MSHAFIYSQHLVDRGRQIWKKSYPARLKMVAPACNPSTWKIEAGGPGIHGHLWLHNKLEGSLDCMNSKHQKEKCKGT